MQHNLQRQPSLKISNLLFFWKFFPPTRSEGWHPQDSTTTAQSWMLCLNPRRPTHAGEPTGPSMPRHLSMLSKGSGPMVGSLFWALGQIDSEQQMSFAVTRNNAPMFYACSLPFLGQNHAPNTPHCHQFQGFQSISLQCGLVAQALASAKLRAWPNTASVSFKI